MRYVTYSLDWRDGSGQQPYIVWDYSQGAQFEGGVTVHGEGNSSRYLGYVWGPDDKCSANIAACVSYYKMQEISAEDAEMFYAQAIGTNVVSPNADGTTQYVSGVATEESGRIIQAFSATPTGWSGNATWAVSSLSEHIAQALAQLKSDCDNFIFQYYPQTNLTALTVMLVQAVATGNPAAANYVSQVWNWTNQALDIYYSKAADISACTTHAQITGITWNTELAALGTQDPGVTLSAAKALFSSSSSSSSSS